MRFGGNYDCVQTMGEILVGLDEHYEPNRKWQQREVGHFLPHNKAVVRLWATAWTKDDPPKFYTARQDMPISPLIDVSDDTRAALALIQPYFRKLIALLDSFLDSRCECIPGPHGELGAHCSFHQKVFGD